MWKILALFLGISAVTADQKCGLSKSPSLGLGDDAAIFPWTGLIYYEKNGNEVLKTFATGTLIDSRHVLVPAYVTSPPPKQILKHVRFGATVLDDSSAGAAQNYAIEKVITHPEYKKEGSRPTKPHDIAIIRLEKPVTISDSISPACLPEKGKSYDADQYYFVTYNTDPTNKEAQKQKHVLQLPRIKPADCENAYKKLNEIINSENSASYTCAGDTENDSCIGDAGSPLLVQNGDSWTAVAFSSFGPRICKTGIPSVFLNIQPYVEWIQSVISEV